MYIGKRFLSGLLAAVMLVSMIPSQAFAAAADSTQETETTEIIEPAQTLAAELVTEATEAATESSPAESVAEEETAPAASPTENSVPETTAETVPETTAESVPETTAETVPETTAETIPQEVPAILSLEQIHKILSRDDKIWVFPLDPEYYGNIVSWCGSLVEEPCVFCGEIHSCSYTMLSDLGQWGLEVAVPQGKPVYAPGSGVLYWMDNFFPDLGLTAVLETKAEQGMSYYCVFTHLSQVELAAETRVQAGEKFALTGCSGSETQAEVLGYAMFMAEEGLGAFFAQDPVINLERIRKAGWAESDFTCGMLNNNPGVHTSVVPEEADSAILPALQAHPGTVQYTFDAAQAAHRLPEDPVTSDPTEPSELLDFPAADPTEEVPSLMTQSVPQEPAAAYQVIAQGSCGADLRWTFDDQNTLRISGTGPMTDYDYYYKLTPWKKYADHICHVIIEEGVTTVGNYAFPNHTAMTDIQLPSTLLSIGIDSFYNCSSLAELNLPEGLAELGEFAFESCSGLINLKLPDSLNEIPRSLLKGCSSLTSLDIGNGVAAVDWSCVELCYNLQDLTIGNSVTELPANVFSCDSFSPTFNNLKTVRLGNSVSTIGDYAFAKCSGLESIVLPESLESIGQKAFWECTNLNSINLPSHLTSVGENAFADMSSLTSLVIPDSLSSIPKEMLRGCTSLTDVTIGNGTTTVDWSFLYLCYSLKTLKVGNGVTSIPAGTFSAPTAFNKLQTVILGDAVTVIGDEAFSKCTALETIQLPESLQSIGRLAFNECVNLKNVRLPSNLTMVGPGAFTQCNSVTSVTIPSSLTSIPGEMYAFCQNITDVTIGNGTTNVDWTFLKGCGNLKNLTVGNGVTKIDRNAFSCSADFSPVFTNLETVTLGKGITEIGPGAFSKCPALTTVSMGDAVVTIGENAFQECLKLNSISLSKGLVTLGPSAFNDCDSLKEIKLPDTLETIGDNAFWSCDGLSTVIIPDKVHTVGSQAFGFCQGLKEVIIGNGVKNFDWTAISADNALESLTVGNSVTSVGKDACHGYKNLKTVILGSSVAVIEDYAFMECSSLEKITVPDSLLYIGENAFDHCKKLKEFPLPEQLQTIGRYAFFCCDLRSVVIPDQVLRVEESVWFGNKNLEEFIIGNGVTYVDWSAIVECPNIKKLIVGDSVTEIPDYCFKTSEVFGKNFQKLESLYLGDSVRSIGKEAFCDCYSLKELRLPADMVLIDELAFLNCKCLRKFYFVKDGEKLQALRAAIMPLGNDYLINLLSEMIYQEENQENIGDADEAIPDKLTILVLVDPLENGIEVECVGAQVTTTVDGQKVTVPTGNNGEAIIRPSAGNVVISKEGYATRTIDIMHLFSDNSVLLRKETDEPVINSLWIDGNDVLRDNSVVIDPFSIDLYSVEADITFPKGAWKRVYLSQPERKDVDITATGGSIQLAAAFDLKQELELVAVDDQNRISRKSFKIQTDYPDFLKNFNFALGDKITFTMPDEWGPILGGSEMELDLNMCFPGEFYIKDGTFRILIGQSHDDVEHEFEGHKVPGKKWNSKWTSKKKADTFIDSMKQFMSDMDDNLTEYEKAEEFYKFNQQLKQHGMALGKQPLHIKGGADAAATAGGYIEGTFDKDGHLQITDMGVMLVLSASADFELPFNISGVPVFAELEMGADLEGQVGALLSGLTNTITPHVTIKGSAYLSVGAGVGIPDVISFSGGGKGTIENVTNFAPRLVKTKFTGGLGVYLKVKALFFTYPLDIPLVEKVIYEYPKPEVVTYAMDSGDWDLYNASRFTADDLSYLGRGSSFMGTEAATFSMASETNARPFVANSYEGAEPQLVCFSDGTRLAVWVGVADGVVNPHPDDLHLYYSYYNGTWTQPQLVDPNGGSTDGTSSLQVVNNEAYIVWMDATSSLNGMPNLQSAAGAMGLTGGVFNKTTQKFEISRISNQLSTQPMVYDNNGTACAVWVQNGGNDWFGQMGGNSILRSQFSNGQWSEPTTVQSGLGPVINLDASSADIAYTVDMDGNLNTANDMEVFRNGSRLTENDYIDSGVCLDGGDLYWYSSGSLVCNGIPCMTDGSKLGSDRFQIVNSHGLKAVIYAVDRDPGSALYVSYASGSEWGSPMMLMDAGTYIPRFDASVTGDGKLTVLIQSQNVSGSGVPDIVFGDSNLIMFNAPPISGNLALKDVVFYSHQYVPNKELPFYLKIHNTAQLPIEQVHIELLDESGAILVERQVNVHLLSGQSKTLGLRYPVKEIVQDRKVTLRVTPVGVKESDTLDNSMQVILGYHDVGIENEKITNTAEGLLSIHGDVVNRGYSVQNNLKVELRKDTPTGEVLDTMVIPALASMELKHIIFNRSPDLTRNYYICLVPSVKDDNAGNNSVLLKTIDSIYEKPSGTIQDTGRSISLIGEIHINQYIQITGFEGVDLTKNGGLLIWNHPVTEQEATFGTEDTLKAGLIQAGNEYTQQGPGIPAKQYADDIYLRVYVQDTNGSYVYSPLVKYSVETYCENQINRGSKVVDVCKALLYYGSAAQKFFHYHTENLADKNLGPAPAFDTGVLTPLSGFTTDITPSTDVKDNGKTLSLSGAIKVNYYYGVENFRVQNAELLVWNGSVGTLSEGNVSYRVPLVKRGNEYTAQSADFAAKEYGNTVFTCAKFVDTAGNVHYTSIQAYHPEQYASNKIAAGKDPLLIDAVQKMVMYGEQARIYFNQ